MRLLRLMGVRLVAVVSVVLVSLYLAVSSVGHLFEQKAAGDDLSSRLPRNYSLDVASEGEALQAKFSEAGLRIVPLWMDENMHCFLEIAQPRSFRYVLRENDPNVLGPTLDYEAAVRITTAYDILDASGGLGPRCWILYGRGADGGVIMERFEIPPIAGGFSIAEPTPELLSEAMSWSISGGAYIPLPQRPPLEQPSREPVYRGDSFSSNLALACDPLGRWVFVVDRDADSISAISLSDGAVIPLDFPTDAGIGANLLDMRVQEHVAEGLKLRARVLDPQGPSVEFLLYSDYDSDGLPDVLSRLTDQEYGQYGYPGVWASDFVRNLSWFPPD